MQRHIICTFQMERCLCATLECERGCRAKWYSVKRWEKKPGKTPRDQMNSSQARSIAGCFVLEDVHLWGRFARTEEVQSWFDRLFCHVGACLHEIGRCSRGQEILMKRPISCRILAWIDTKHIPDLPHCDRYVVPVKIEFSARR